VPEAEPLFRLSRWNGRYAAIAETLDMTLEEDRLKSLLDKVRKLYPPPPPV